VLGGQALAAAGATTGDDLLTVLGRHSQTEAMTAAAHQSGGLKRALHDEAPIIEAAQAGRPGAMTARC